MKYLIEMTKDNITYEAWVSVYADEDGLDVDYATELAYANNEVILRSELPDVVYDMLLDEAADMYRMDDGADAVYDAMRDGEWR